MREIPLTQGKVALVDDGDFERVSVFKWYAANCQSSWYAARMVRENGKRAVFFMHWLIGGRRELDHINGNGLDNRKSNLRECSRSQNLAARRCGKRGRALPKGVYADGGKFKASIRENGRTRHLGMFVTPEEASAAFEREARRIHGEFACSG